MLQPSNTRQKYCTHNFLPLSGQQYENIVYYETKVESAGVFQFQNTTGVGLATFIFFHDTSNIK